MPDSFRLLHARFVGQVSLRNEGRLDQEFSALYFGGIIRIFMEEIGSCG